MPELDHITIKGFKSIASLENLALGAINVVIGANGSGKSNFLSVFAFLQAIREGRLQEYVTRSGGADKLLHFGEKTTPEISVVISFWEGSHQYEIELIPTTQDHLYPKRESINFWRTKDSGEIETHGSRLAGLVSSYTEFPEFRPEASISDPPVSNDDATSYVRSQLASWRVYHFHDTSGGSPMKKTSDLNDNRFLRPDGSNLAAFLYLLREKHPTEATLIRRTVQQVAPFFDDFSLEPQRLNPGKIQLEWQHRRSDQYFDAASLSDGTLRFMALAALFLQPVAYRPSVIVVDEPELGLHPLAITLLASLIRSASVQTQVIVSTQSPQLLDHFEPEEVLVADLVEGNTRIHRLDGDRLADWLGEYSLGQLWEKNEIGGRPGTA